MYQMQELEILFFMCLLMRDIIMGCIHTSGVVLLHTILYYYMKTVLPRCPILIPQVPRLNSGVDRNQCNITHLPSSCWNKLVMRSLYKVQPNMPSTEVETITWRSAIFLHANHSENDREYCHYNIIG